jgi:hypothetical protein
MAYECSNPESDYYKALLNVNFQGDQQNNITWPGCFYGEPVEGGGL